MPTEGWDAVIWVRADCGALRDAFMAGSTPNWPDADPGGHQLEHVADELLRYFAGLYGWRKVPVRGQVAGIAWEGFNIGFLFNDPHPEMEETDAD